MIALPRIPFVVVLEDNAELRVTPDQRDHRRAMMVCGIDMADQTGFVRAIAWSALSREGRLPPDIASWGDFDTRVPWVVPDGDGAVVGAVDPTQPLPGAG